MLLFVDTDIENHADYFFSAISCFVELCKCDTLVWFKRTVSDRLEIASQMEWYGTPQTRGRVFLKCLPFRVTCIYV